MLAAHRVKEQCEVFDVARHRAVDRQVAVDLESRAMRHPADAWPHADDAAEACGVAQRAAHVGAVGEPRRAGCECHRRTAGGAGCGARRVPWVTRRAKHLVECMGAGAEFRGIGFCVDDAAIAFKQFDDDVGAGGHGVFVNRRALSGSHAGDVGEVLDRDRKPGEQAAFAQRLLHQRLRIRARPIKAQGRQRIGLAVNLGDPLLQCVQQVERRDLAGIELVNDCACR